MSSAAQPISTPEQNKQLVLRWFDEVWNQGRRETIFELFPEGSHLYDGAAKLSGPDEFCRFYDGLRADFSDFVHGLRASGAIAKAKERAA